MLCRQLLLALLPRLDCKRILFAGSLLLARAGLRIEMGEAGSHDDYTCSSKLRHALAARKSQSLIRSEVTISQGSLRQDPPTLIVRAVMHSIEDLAKAHRLVGARVAYKKNAQGEPVVALIFPSQPP